MSTWRESSRRGSAVRLRRGFGFAFGIENLHGAVFIEYRFELDRIAHGHDLQVVRHDVLARHALHLFGVTFMILAG